jgi:hypothetical protein
MENLSALTPVSAKARINRARSESEFASEEAAAGLHGLAHMPDPTRKDEIIWSELVEQRLDVSDSNARWLAEFKKKHGL